LLAIPAPRLGFIGALSGYKVDFELLRRLAEARPDWSVVLIGKVGEGDPGTDASLLAGPENIHLLGPRDYKDLPAYLKGFDVALLPSRLNDYTESMFPMKFFEYLAAGVPVVSVDLPALRQFRGAFYLGSTLQRFVAAVEAALAEGEAPKRRRRALAEEQTYERRTEKMMDILGRSRKHGMVGMGAP
jgi:glycosyltransferase involved in cell wall biosynthesis